MQRATTERTCPSVWHRFILLRGRGVSAAREQAPGTAICWCIWSSLVLFVVFSPGEKCFCPSLPLEGLASDTEKEHAAMHAAAVWMAFYGPYFGQTAWRQFTSVKLKWSLCRRTRNPLQLPFQSCIDRLTSVLPSNTPFPPLPHLYTACMHSTITGTSPPLSLPKIFPSKPNQWVPMYRTAGPRLLPHWAKSAFSTAPSKQTNESSSKSTGIAIRLDTVCCGGKGTMHCPVAKDIICACASDTSKGCRTKGSTRIPFLLPGQNCCIKLYIRLSI